MQLHGYMIAGQTGDKRAPPFPANILSKHEWLLKMMENMTVCVGGLGVGGEEGKYMNYRNMGTFHNGMFLMDIFTPKVNCSFHFHQHLPSHL